MSNTSDDTPRPRRALDLPAADENRAITTAACSDPDAQPLTPDQFQAMVPMSAGQSSEEQDTEMRFRAQAAQGARARGLALLDKLDQAQP